VHCPKYTGESLCDSVVFLLVKTIVCFVLILFVLFLFRLLYRLHFCFYIPNHFVTNRLPETFFFSFFFNLSVACSLLFWCVGKKKLWYLGCFTRNRYIREQGWRYLPFCYRLVKLDNGNWFDILLNLISSKFSTGKNPKHGVKKKKR